MSEHTGHHDDHAPDHGHAPHGAASDHTHGRHGFLPAMGHDRLLPLYDVFTRLAGGRAAHRQLAEAAAVAPGAHVLEIGCGTGSLALLVAGRDRSVAVTGLDPDPKALAVAARKARRRRLDVRWDQGFAGELPYPDASQDRVLSSMMFHHLDADEKVRALREAWRVLRPGGELHLLDVVADATRGPLAEMAAGNAGERIPDAMREAGFTGVARTGTVRLRLGIGQCATFRGTR